MSNYIKKKNESDLFNETSLLKDFFQMPFFKHDNILKTDIIENENSYTLILDVPGYKKEDVKITNDEGYLTIEVSQANSTETTSNSYIKRERMHGSYSRSYYIGNKVDSKSINAKFSNGVLEITFPKEDESSSATYIPINGN